MSFLGKGRVESESVCEAGAYTESVMICPKFGLSERRAAWCLSRAALVFGVGLLILIGLLTAVDNGRVTAQQVLSVTASPTVVPARDGESRISVRVPADRVGESKSVTLSTELGAFDAVSGPPRIDAMLSDVGNGMLGITVSLVGDGRVGTTVVRAQVGSLVDTVTIRFVGETSSLRLLEPSDRSRLDASAQHVLRLEASDDTGIGAPSAQILLRLVDAPEGAQLRSGVSTSMSELSIVTNSLGLATVVLTSAPGDVQISASSGAATLEMEFQLYGAPRTLRLLSTAGSALEAGQVTGPGAIQALLQDERGQGVPDQRIVFQAEGGIVVDLSGDGTSNVTDDSGAARVRLDSRNARLGMARVSATWFGDGVELRDDLTIRVTGPPVALYLRAELTSAEVDEYLLEDFLSSSRYRLSAEVVDRMGQRVAGEYQVRWWPVVGRAGAQVYPQVSVTRQGVATAIFDLQHVDGRALTEATEARAWLIAKAQVNNSGLISNLLGEGVPLRSSWNDLVWRGEEVRVSEAVSSIEDVVTAAWRRSVNGRWQAWFTADVPGAVDFILQPGDDFHLVLRSAALLEGVERR